MAKLIPLDGRVILKGVKAEETTKSGIILPKAGEEKPRIFEVIAVSKGKLQDDGKVRPHELKKGQKVVCSQYAGDDIKIEEEEFKIIDESSVSAIVEN